MNQHLHGAMVCVCPFWLGFHLGTQLDLGVAAWTQLDLSFVVMIDHLRIRHWQGLSGKVVDYKGHCGSEAVAADIRCGAALHYASRARASSVGTYSLRCEVRLLTIRKSWMRWMRLMRYDK